MQPVEIILKRIEEVKLFLLANTHKDHTLTEPNIISYAVIKLTKTGGVYVKGIEKWQKRPPQDCKKWAEFLARMVEDYKRHLTETGGHHNGKKRIWHSYAR